MDDKLNEDEIDDILKNAIITVDGEEINPRENLQKLMKDPTDSSLPDDTHAMAYTPEGDITINEGNVRTGGSKQKTETPRPSTTPKPQRKKQEDEDIDVDIDSLINEVDDDENHKKKEEEEALPATRSESLSTEIDLDEKHSLANKIVENSLDVIGKADKVFTNFSDDVMYGRDRSTSSKEMLIKALEIQNSANKNLIDLARTIDKENSGNTNILIGASISPKKSGVNPDNLKTHFRK